MKTWSMEDGLLYFQERIYVPELLQQLALRFRNKHRASEARKLRSNIVTEKCSEVSTFRETHFASEDLN
jgi:hypothetical protein